MTNLVTEKDRKVIEEFEYMRNMAELRALSNYSIEHPLTDGQHKRMMSLKEKAGL